MDIQILDTRFMGMEHVTAVYLLHGPEGPVLVETGPASTLTAVIDALATHGLRPSDIRHILVTHIHLDHAGAAGWWAQQGARIYVHHIGAPHLIDPVKLLTSATRIYGARMDELWGTTLPAPPEQVTALYDGDIVAVNGLRITALDTPGHAWHHHAYQIDSDEGRIVFTGDVAGVRLPHVGSVDLPAPPPEFNLEAWLASLEKLEAARADIIYPTHFGPNRDVHGHLSALRAAMVDSVAFVAQRLDDLGGVAQATAPETRAALLEDYLGWNRQRAAALGIDSDDSVRFELANPAFMSVDGILRYLRKR